MSTSIRPCRCGFTAQEMKIPSDNNRITVYFCDNCKIASLDLNSWNFIMDTSGEDALREAAKEVVEGCTMLNEFDYFVSQDAIAKLKGLL